VTALPGFRRVSSWNIAITRISQAAIATMMANMRLAGNFIKLAGLADFVAFDSIPYLI
jgi:hypothetical protein